MKKGNVQIMRTGQSHSKSRKLVAVEEAQQHSKIMDQRWAVEDEFDFQF